MHLVGYLYDRPTLKLGFLDEVQFRRQRVLPVHKNCSLDRYGDLQLPVDRPCLWSGIALDLSSDYLVIIPPTSVLPRFPQSLKGNLG